jgi:hypothetical protein
MAREKARVNIKTIRSFASGWPKKYSKNTGTERIAVPRKAVRQRAMVSMRALEYSIMFSSSVIKWLL